MGKLMKYEWKKQRTSRMIVMVALAVCVLAFLGGMLVEKDALMGISATLLLVGSFFVVFYMGIESILILNRDLKTKQSYMIWMTPKSVWEILGAKFVVAIAQMFFVFALYAIAGLLCFVGTIQYVGELGNVFAIIRDSFYTSVRRRAADRTDYLESSLHLCRMDRGCDGWLSCGNRFSNYFKGFKICRRNLNRSFLCDYIYNRKDL